MHVAVQDYRDSLGAFFGRLAEERDASAIARLAGTLPVPPNLDEVRADARVLAMQALEQEAAAETPAPDREHRKQQRQLDAAQGPRARDGTGRRAARRDVRWRGRPRGHPGPVDGVRRPSVGQPSADRGRPDRVDRYRSVTHAILAARLVQFLTSWTSPTGSPTTQLAPASAGGSIGGDGGESNSPSRTLRRRPLRACPMVCRRSPGRASALCRAIQSRAPRSGLTPDYVTLVRIAASLHDASTTREAEAASTLTLLPKQRGRESTGGCQVLLFAT